MNQGWYALISEDKLGSHYYSSINGPEQEYHFFNPHNTPITIKHETPAGLLTDIVVPANSAVWASWDSATIPDSDGHHFYTENDSTFYVNFVYDGQTSTARREDWGASLIPESRLYQQILSGWGEGQDPTKSPGLNGSPVWVTAAFPSTSSSTGQITICVDYNSDNIGPLTDAYGKTMM